MDTRVARWEGRPGPQSAWPFVELTVNAMTMDDSWIVTWSAKVTTAQRAIALIRRGQRVLIGSGAAEPVTLVEALVSHGRHLADNEIVHLLTLGPAPYVAPEFASRFRHSAFFIGPNVRDAVQEGRADFVPVFLSEIPELILNRRMRIAVALIQTSPPDVHGYVSLGVSVDIVRAAVDSADLVLAEVNPRMPRTHGDSFLHVSKIHGLVPVDRPLLELASGSPGEVESAIGHHVASLIANGATIQTGIGSIPDAVLAALSNHRDLGVHTEMLSDGIMALVRAGVVTGAKKSLLRGKLVTSFVMGSQNLYAWAHDNPALEMRGSGFTNSPGVIARNDNMVSVNSALAADLTGQVAADTLLGKFFSGIGGQVDFLRGSAGSRGGRSIIALRATAKDGTVSPISSRTCFDRRYGRVRVPVASQAVTSSESVKAMQAQLGHRPERSTHPYAHLGSGAQLRLVEALKPARTPHEARARWGWRSAYDRSASCGCTPLILRS